MGEEVGRYNGAYKVSQGLLDKFGSARVVDAPISELGFAGLGVGAAMVGLRPVIEMMTWNFAILAMDQIVNSAAKLRHMSGGQLRCPIVFRGPNGAGGRLSAQHSQALEANYAHFPGLKVIAPAHPGRRQGPAQGGHPRRQPGHLHGRRAALRREGRGARRRARRSDRQGRHQARGQGRHHRHLVPHVLLLEQAAQELAKEGINVEVLDLRTLRPLDEEAIVASVRKTNRAVIVEEGWALARRRRPRRRHHQSKCFDDLDAPVLRVTGLDVNMSYAANLENAIQPDAPKVVAAVKQVLYREGA